MFSSVADENLSYQLHHEREQSSINCPIISLICGAYMIDYQIILEYRFSISGGTPSFITVLNYAPNRWRAADDFETNRDFKIIRGF